MGEKILSEMHLEKSPLPLRERSATQSQGEGWMHANGLSCTYGEKIIFADYSLTLTPGKLIHIIGENGSGKTSLLKILAGLKSATEGSVQWQVPFTYIGFQEVLKEHLTVKENVAWIASLFSLDTTLIDAALEAFDLSPLAEAKANTLSAGERRKLFLSRLYWNQDPVWLLDEPFVALDQKAQEKLQQLFIKKIATAGSIIFTSHQMLLNNKFNSLQISPLLSGNSPPEEGWMPKADGVVEPSITPHPALCADLSHKGRGEF
jgi:heme exporter protein A